MDAEQEYLLRKLLEGYLPAPEPSVDASVHRREERPAAAASGPLAVWETLDAYERVFFAEGATLEYVRSAAAEWRATGLSAREVHQWLDAGVYPDEPELAAALAGAGFDPHEARRTTVRYRSDSELLNVISAVRGRTAQADWAVELRNRLRAVHDVAPAVRAG